MSLIKVSHYNQTDISNELEITNILIPIGSTIQGSISDGRITIHDCEGRVRFQCEYNENKQRHGDCYAWQPYDGGCSSTYENGKRTGYSY
jgi:hypothetical protein